MLDPLPPAPSVLTTLTTPIASFFSLTTLPLHSHEILASFAFYLTTQLYLAPLLSKALIPKIYASFNTRTRINWNVHIVSFIQSIVVCYAGLWVIYTDKEREGLDWRGRVWGYTGSAGMVQGLALGYFIWDFWVCVRYLHIFGWGMLAHGASALAVYSLGFRPFVNFYAPTFILYELSSPFLNIHWALDKLHLTGSIYQLVNGIFLISTFAACRLAWGSYQSLFVFADIVRALRHPGTHIVLADPFGEVPAAVPSVDGKDEVMRFAGDAVVPLWLALTYLGSNVTLNTLNWYWFGKMVQTIKKRFEPGAKEKGEKIAANGDVKGQGSAVKGQDGEVRKRKV